MAAVASRLVLEGVPRVHFYHGGPGCPENIPFPSVMRALMEYLHEGDLMHAAACYAAEHRLMWELWDLAGGNGNPDAFRRFSDPSVRRRMVPVIELARENDEQAAAHIERALRQG